MTGTSRAMLALSMKSFAPSRMTVAAVASGSVPDMITNGMSSRVRRSRLNARIESKRGSRWSEITRSQVLLESAASIAAAVSTRTISTGRPSLPSSAIKSCASSSLSSTSRMRETSGVPSIVDCCMTIR